MKVSHRWLFSWRGFGVVLICLLSAVAADAHPITGPHGGFSHSLEHPFQGLDHIVVLLALGITAIALGKRACWSLPVAFLTGIGLGMTATFPPAALLRAAFSAAALLLAAIVCLRGHRGYWISLLSITAFLGMLQGTQHSFFQGAGTAAPELFGLLAGSLVLYLWGISAGLLLKGVSPARLAYSTGAIVALMTVGGWLL